MEDVVMIYRTVSMPNGGEAADPFVDPTFRDPFADWMGFFFAVVAIRGKEDQVLRN
jgi:hypothetical protein